MSDDPLYKHTETTDSCCNKYRCIEMYQPWIWDLVLIVIRLLFCFNDMYSTWYSVGRTDGPGVSWVRVSFCMIWLMVIIDFESESDFDFEKYIPLSPGSARLKESVDDKVTLLANRPAVLAQILLKQSSILGYGDRKETPGIFALTSFSSLHWSLLIYGTYMTTAGNSKQTNGVRMHVGLLHHPSFLLRVI